jgi:galactose mutarotase-like enzyme
MKNLEQKLNPILKTETIKTPEGNEVSFCPERGGIITSIKLQGKEILYLDKETFEDTKVNVKGGIPVLFPNAGPIPDDIKTEELKNLKQHGFARESKWNSQKEINGFKETLDSNSETKESFPYDFELTIDGHFEKDNSFTITQAVESKEKNKEISISSGFHPYFKVLSEEKKNIEFNFKGGEIVKEKTEIWANGKAVSIENPNTPIEVNIPGLGVLVFNISKEYKRIWVWSMEGKDFICVEPVMRDKGGIITDPEKIKPGETHISSFNILLKE